MLIVKVHDSPNGKLAAVCDKDILGNKYEEGGLQLDLSGEFYRGEEMPPEEITNVLKSCYHVRLGVKIGIVSKEHILRVRGVPHAMVMVGAD